MQPHITEIIEALRPALKSIRKAEGLLAEYWLDRIALIWTIEAVHRAANENETVLTELQARQLLHTLHQQHNPQYGLRWEDLTESMQHSGVGRDIHKRELHRFIHRDHITIDPPLKRKDRR